MKKLRLEQLVGVTGGWRKPGDIVLQKDPKRGWRQGQVGQNGAVTWPAPRSPF